MRTLCKEEKSERVSFTYKRFYRFTEDENFYLIVSICIKIIEFLIFIHVKRTILRRQQDICVNITLLSVCVCDARTRHWHLVPVVPVLNLHKWSLVLRWNSSPSNHGTQRRILKFLCLKMAHKTHYVTNEKDTHSTSPFQLACFRCF